ncbi:MAG: TDT family transporter [Mycolicibacterium sp.]|uniref:TDT family transporter n=1 Tax=Mycolicibacterium sp. TaxID=2320850 RepID=UPI003D0B027F
MTSDESKHGRYFGPNWFASVMGTGIVATAGSSLPVHVPGLRTFALVVWVAAAVWLVVLAAATGVHWLRNPTLARSHVRNPQMSHFYGAAPMALLTVGSGALLVGKDLIGERAAVDLAWVLWTLGTVGGLFTAMSIPFLMFTQLRVEPDAAFGGWLMPVVPPMVAAATGALLIPHMDPGTGQTTMLYSCYAMFGMSLVASLIIITMIWSRLALYGTSGTARVPTLWIVLGPLGQSITVAGLLATDAALAVDEHIADGMSVFAVLYGVPVWGFAVLWIAIATALTTRTLRRGMPFALTWWSLTFPVGTFVTGTTQLALHTGLPAFRVAAAIAYIALLSTWVLVAVRTFRGGRQGVLFATPAAGPIRAHKDSPAPDPAQNQSPAAHPAQKQPPAADPAR